MKKKSKKVDTEQSGTTPDFSVLDEFLRESNHIEMEYSFTADMDARDAWDFLMEQKTLTPDVVLETHWILMKNLRPDIAGEFRHCDVYIGGHRKVFISEALIKSDLKDFLLQLNKLIIYFKDKETKDKESMCEAAHIRFEDLHVFEDCNGRTGRIIWNWSRIKLGLPIKIIHADYPKKDGEQVDYYKLFKKTGEFDKYTCLI